MELEIPRHIAITMDGNGRWGKENGVTRSQGHFAGSRAMEQLIYDSLEIGVKILTLYAFSTENWKRPKDEVQYLMDLPAQFFREKLPEFKEKNIRICILGDIEGLPPHTKDAVKTSVRETQDNRNLIVNFALNYGGRSEILMASKSIVSEILNRKLTISDIN